MKPYETSTRRACYVKTVKTPGVARAALGSGEGSAAGAALRGLGALWDVERSFCLAGAVEAEKKEWGSVRRR